MRGECPIVIHTVKSGETVYSIANQYGVSPERLISDNQLINPNKLLIGQAILVLFPEIVHRVNPGESIYSVAQNYGISPVDLVRNNPYLITSPFVPGQEVVIKYSDEKIGDIVASGYAYPFINRDVLNEALVYLTELAIFSYGFTGNGELIPPNDSQLLSIAKRNGVSTILVLTPLDQDDRFNSYLVTQISQNDTARKNLIQNLLKTVKAKGYSGVNVDFEYIPASDADGFVNFVAELTNEMNAQGYTVSVALAPKTSDDQVGLLYEGMDYQRLGESANSVLLMTYEWGYKYGPPMAVAPINKVREVLNYAVTKIPSNKISMGIPNYGYDWPLPFVKGQTEADTIGNLEAIMIAYRHNAQIHFDSVAQSPYFEYTQNGVSHVVWFEDARSIDVKLRTVADYGFFGVGYWTVMNYFRQNWLLLNRYFNII